MSIRSRSRYGEGEARALVESYAEQKEQRDTAPGRPLRNLIQVADLQLAWRHLRRDFKRVVLLHGFLGLSQDATSELLDISQQAVSKRYRQALEEIHYHLNGGDES